MSTTLPWQLYKVETSLFKPASFGQLLKAQGPLQYAQAGPGQGPGTLSRHRPGGSPSLAAEWELSCPLRVGKGAVKRGGKACGRRLLRRELQMREEADLEGDFRP